MTRRRGTSLRETILLGIALMPIVFAVTFFGLVLATDAMGVGSLPGLEELVQDLLGFTDFVVSPRVPETALAVQTQPPTPFQPPPAALGAEVELPSPTAEPSPTTSPSATSTPSETPTATPTSTETPTRTPTATSTSSPTATPSATASATRTPTVTRSPTRTPTRTATQVPSLMPSATIDIQPTEGGASATPTSPSTPSTCTASANAGVEAQVVELINTERVSRGLADYGVDSRLVATARVQATDMACNHFTSHTGSDGSSVRDRVAAQGYAWSWIGENYYVTGNTESGAQVAFDWWMNSTPHRDNLLSPNYTQFGVGYVYDANSDYGGYFVVVFARPQ